MKYILLLLLLPACKVAFVPTRNDIIIAQVMQGQRTTDSIYDVMITGDKTYNPELYDMIQGEITALSTEESGRNKIIASQVAKLQSHFNYYRGQHQVKSLNAAELTTYKNDLDAFWQPILNSEKTLK